MANVRRGHETERLCATALRERGYAVTRSAASKGCYDIIAIGSNDILLIQCKRTKAYARRAEPKVLRQLQDAPAPISNHIKKQLWCWVDRRGWIITDIGSFFP